MKILIVTSVYFPDVIGGGEFSLKLVAEGLANRGHDITIECLGVNDIQEEINGVHVNRHYINTISESELSHTRNHEGIVDPLSRYEKLKYRFSDLYYNKKKYQYYKKLISDGGYNAVHSATALNFMGRYNLWRAAYDLNIPVSHIARSPQLLKLDICGGLLNRWFKGRVRKSARYLNAFTAPSQYMIDQHRKNGINVPMMYPIYNALDMKMKKLTHEEINSKKNMILYAGDLRKEKGIYTLYKSFCEMDSSTKLVYVGSGEEYEKLTRLENITVHNWMAKEELYKLMTESKIVVLPSEWEEAFGRTLIESVFLGTLSIGSNSGGIPEVLDFDNRYVFKSGDYQSLKSLIIRILNLSSSEYAEELMQQQKKMERFTGPIFLDSWEKFFLDQIRGRDQK